MPLIITPRQLSLRAELYYQLGALTTAGVPLPQAVESLCRTVRSFHHQLSRLHQFLLEGYTFSEALTKLGRWLPAFDIALIEAGEQSGRLDATFKLLSNYYRERAVLVRNVLADLAYPLFIFHFAFLILPIANLQGLVLRGDVGGFVLQKLAFFLPFYGVVFLGIYGTQGRHGEHWRSIIESILRPVPLLGSARRSLALARLSTALEALLNAGVSIITAWELAAAASGSPALHRSVLAWKPRVLAGQTPAEAISESRAFPELFANLYHTGEISGQLDQALARLHAYYQDEGSRKLKLVSQGTPWLVYAAVIAVVAWQIISFWLGYFQQVGEAAGF